MFPFYRFYIESFFIFFYPKIFSLYKDLYNGSSFYNTFSPLNRFFYEYNKIKPTSLLIAVLIMCIHVHIISLIYFFTQIRILKIQKLTFIGPSLCDTFEFRYSMFAWLTWLCMYCIYWIHVKFDCLRWPPLSYVWRDFATPAITNTIYALSLYK